MYSLYRAWFLRETASNPDVLITVGTGRQSHQFAGHRTLLANQSGYLKSQLAVSDTNQVSVPNVSPDVFAPLLTFMYTGFLDLTPDNIYAVLLATHLLHMPRALDLCRSYLVQNQQSAPFSQPPALVKPIPSRKLFPALLPPPPSGVYWPPPPYHLPTPSSTPFRPVFQPLVNTKSETEISERQQSSPLAVPSTSAERQVSPPPSSLSPCLSQASDSSDHVTVTVSSRSKPRKQTGHEQNAKVIVDVACCDGPVRFHRVLNHNYGLDTRELPSKAKKPPPQTTSNNTETTKIVTETVRPESTHRSTEKEDQPNSFCGEGSQAQGGGGSRGESSGTVFTCHYCNHTFKSHYCYQKHARRHLNPVSVQPSKPKPAPKREVRLLDMNVQYYPCKTCGSKFPSYYFVHKHRKLCHPNEESTASSTPVHTPQPSADESSETLTV